MHIEIAKKDMAHLLFSGTPLIGKKIIARDPQNVYRIDGHNSYHLTGLE